MSSYSQEKQVAISAVLKASLVARKVQDQLIGSGGVQKKDKSPVTGKLVLSLSICGVGARRERVFELLHDGCVRGSKGVG